MVLPGSAALALEAAAFLLLLSPLPSESQTVRVLRSTQRLSEKATAVDGIKLVFNENPTFEDFSLCMRFNFKSLYKDIVSIRFGVSWDYAFATLNI